MPDCLLDASALIALFKREPGAAAVAAACPAAAISAANLAEVVAHRALPPDALRSAIAVLRLPVVPFGENEALQAGALLRAHRGRLSLADCACIATAGMLGLAVLTGDRIWASLDLGIEVRLIRP